MTSPIIQWLNVNAGALQALGSLISALLTLILVVVTWRYVRLTRTLSDLAYADVYEKLKLDFERTWRASYDFGKFQVQVDIFNRNPVSVRVKELYIWAYYPGLKRPEVVHVSMGQEVLKPMTQFGVVPTMPPGYSEIYERTKKDFANTRTASLNDMYYFHVAMNFSDLRGAVQHSCVWSIGGMSYEAKYYRPPSRFCIWLREARYVWKYRIRDWKYYANKFFANVIIRRFSK